MGYFDGIENEENEIRPVFIPNACHVCKALSQQGSQKEPEDSGPNCKRLLSCSGCRLIAYCGAAHQKEHWPQHKDICKVVQNILRRDAKKSLFAGIEQLNLNQDAWRTLRYNYMTRAESMLNVKICLFRNKIPKVS